ncbi:hypothetical protein [Alteribacter populi]|uniref:hypothetical protein n=1 Tax=Alteribacter populi TaxID=2011011 RepID=UPI000BBAA31E|nr:hypothetical protein [Alteribacter populi]
MKTLSLYHFRLAVEFINRHARLVDQRLFEFYFDNGSPEAVLEALSLTKTTMAASVTEWNRISE